jgi:hypothetical protein
LRVEDEEQRKTQWRTYEGQNGETEAVLGSDQCASKVDNLSTLKKRRKKMRR